MERETQPPLNAGNKKYSEIALEENQVNLSNIISTGVHLSDRIIRNRKQLEWVIGIFKKDKKRI